MNGVCVVIAGAKKVGAGQAVQLTPMGTPPSPHRDRLLWPGIAGLHSLQKAAIPLSPPTMHR